MLGDLEDDDALGQREEGVVGVAADVGAGVELVVVVWLDWFGGGRRWRREERKKVRKKRSKEEKKKRSNGARRGDSKSRKRSRDSPFPLPSY